MYTARITRAHRAAFILLCDRSGSMAEMVTFGGTTMRKADAVSDIINLFIDELIHRCRREEGIRDYFDIALLEYCGHGTRSLLSPEGEFRTPSELARMAVETETKHILRRLPGGNQISIAVERRKWIAPKAEGGTPMGEAIDHAEKLARTWCSRPENRDSFPPVIINITDGEASDSGSAELCESARRIKELGTEDGEALLINIHLARREGGDVAEVSFPSDPAELPPHPYARLLWEMSSTMPECYNDIISGTRRKGSPPYRAMSYNCAVDELFHMLTIGSISSAIIV